jgi:hypothetical protein
VSLASALWLVGVLVALLLYVRLPNRVLIPLEGGATFIAVIVPGYLTSSTRRDPARPQWMSMAVAALVALLLFGTAWDGVRSPTNISTDNARALRKRTRAYAALTDIDPEGVFLARGDFFGLNADPLSAHTPFDNPKFIALGWATNSPLFDARLERVGIRDVYRSLARDPHVYLYGNGVEVRRVALFYKQHRGPVAYKQASPQTYHGYSVWSFERAPAENQKVPAAKVASTPG